MWLIIIAAVWVAGALLLIAFLRGASIANESYDIVISRVLKQAHFERHDLPRAA
jgi:hypothetical protein